MRRASGRDLAYDHLRSALLTDPSLVGTFINEGEVAAAVGVSRTPVREALLLLSAEGLVQLVPNRGAFVPPVGPDEIHAILQARTVIESWAAREAMRTLSLPMRALHESLDQQKAMPPEASAASFIACDRDFHAALVAAGGNPVITQMYEGVRARHVMVGVKAITRDPDSRQHVIAEHRAILDALESGDPDVAEHAIRTHLLRTASRHARA